MLAEIFYWLLSMSITATVTGLCVLLIRAIRKVPRSLICVLWAIPFIRMWLPIGFGSPYSLLTLLISFHSRSVEIPGLDYTAMNHVAAADSYFPISFKTNQLANIFTIASTVWLIVAALLLIVLTVLYFAEKRSIRSAVLDHQNVWFSECVKYPTVYGLVSPKIVLPSSCMEQDQTFVLMHEKMHIRRKDNFWRLLGIVTAVIHWYNPFTWLYLKCFLMDLEFACDEGVLRQCGEEQRKAYASALLDSAQSGLTFVSCFGGGKLRKRVERILTYRKLSLFSAVCAVIFALFVACTLLTNPI